MRLARARDFRRRLQDRAAEWPVRLTRISFNGIPSLGEGDFPVSSPLTVFCGPNGVGKTTILRAIWAALSPAADSEARDAVKSLKLSAGTATVDILRRDERSQVTATFANGVSTVDVNSNLEVVHIDASRDTIRLQDYYGRFANPEDIINGSGARPLTERELESINYLTKREYHEIRLYEVEVTDDTAPFFEVTLGPSRYDSRTMGSGEFAAFFLWWNLERAVKNSILLIEEPETFLSPGSQSAFSDHLLSVMFSKKICAVVTSHTGELIGPLPEVSIRFLRRDENVVRLVTDTPSPVLLETIGIHTRVDILAFVEDQAALSFCKLWIEAHEPFLTRRMKIIVKNGDGEIVSLLRAVDNSYGDIRILGLFDGDMRGRVPEELAGKALFLPGNLPIERTFKDLVQAHPQALQAALDGRDIRDTLFALQGLDHHDWFLRLSENLGFSPGQMFMLLYRLWIHLEENRASARVSFDALRAKLTDDEDPEENAA